MTFLRLNSAFLVRGQGEKIGKKVHHTEIELVAMFFVVQITVIEKIYILHLM